MFCYYCEHQFPNPRCRYDNSVVIAVLFSVMISLVFLLELCFYLGVQLSAVSMLRIISSKRTESSYFWISLRFQLP